MVQLDPRRELLRAALGFLGLEPHEPELRRLHRCFDNWRGVGQIVAGIAREEYDLELRRYDGQGWRAMFFRYESPFGGLWFRKRIRQVRQPAKGKVPT
jgi:hypothetical protein